MPTGSAGNAARRAGVGQLIAAAQGRNRQGAASGPAQPEIPLRAVFLFGKAKILAQTQQARANLLGVFNHRARRARVGADGRRRRPKNPGFFAANRLARAAQPILVVQVHAGQHRAAGVKSVGGVQPAAQADFQHNHVHLGRDKGMHRRQGGKLKISQPGVAAPGLDSGKAGGQLGVAGGLEVNRHPFVVGQQMRRGKRPHPIAGGVQDGGQHGAHRALAIGAGHSDHRAGRNQSHGVAHGAHAVQPQVDAVDVEGFQPGQPIGQRQVLTHDVRQCPVRRRSSAAPSADTPAAGARRRRGRCPR